MYLGGVLNADSSAYFEAIHSEFDPIMESDLTWSF